MNSPSPVIMRAAVWSLIGLIYGPLFIVLQQLLTPTFSGAATALAAATAGAIGASFYGARQLALMASVVGVVAGTSVLLALGPTPDLAILAAVAIGLGLLAGAVVNFPNRCTLNIGRKFVVGGVVGALAGAVLAGVNGLLPTQLPTAAAVAFLVSVNGVLYVTGLTLWRADARGGRPRFCSVTEGLVIAIIALFVAASMAALAGMFADQGPSDGLGAALASALDQLPLALLGGIMAGAITGGLLEFFRFAWVDDGP